MEPCGRSWNCIEAHGKLWKVLEEYSSSLHNPVVTMEYHGNPEKSMEAHRNPWKVPQDSHVKKYIINSPVVQRERDPPYLLVPLAIR